MKNSRRFGAVTPKTRSAVSRDAGPKLNGRRIMGGDGLTDCSMLLNSGNRCAFVATGKHMIPQPGHAPLGFSLRSVAGTHSRVPNALPIALTLFAIATTFLFLIILINL